MCFTRNIDSDKYTDVFITDSPIDIHITSGQNYLAPIYLDESPNDEINLHITTLNLGKTDTLFMKEWYRAIGFKTSQEDILDYIYAVLHSPVYRLKYIEFLKTDFPAVPMTKDWSVFRDYARLGARLIDLHLLRNRPDDSAVRVSLGGVEGGFTLRKVSHDDGRLLLLTTNNERIAFDGVSSDIYNFEIGSYKPIEKWLKYRVKDEVMLNHNDLSHIKDMIIAIKNTISAMAEIEALGEAYLK
ncbi:hypothetical protein FACS1894186_8640 [Alphaproteobacteria bacterium]|nr:hypothetical protein FACS1894186_8640 [Alphaproteobacteria bacterium]